MHAASVSHMHAAAGFCMQATFVLPWRWALLIQLVNLAAALGGWSTQLPCLLQAAQLQPNNATELFYQPQATDACEALQFASGWLRAAVGNVTDSVVDHGLCQGLLAVQVLQAFMNIVCLAVLPLLVLYVIERRYKLQFLQSLQASSAAAGGAAASAGSSNTSTSNNRGARDQSSDTGMRWAAVAGSNSIVNSGSYTAGALNEFGAAVASLWLICFAGVLTGSWLLAELVVIVASNKKACA
jgi:hypothetical protein